MCCCPASALSSHCVLSWSLSFFLQPFSTCHWFLMQCRDKTLLHKDIHTSHSHVFSIMQHFLAENMHVCVSPLLCGKCCHSSLLNDRKVFITHCVRLQSPDTPLGGALTCTCLHSPQGPCESLVMTGLILTEEWNKDEDDCTTDDCLI